MLIGVLSLQGDYQLHGDILTKLNVEYLYINNIKDLNRTDALIIPGGESTVISKLLKNSKLDIAIQKYGKLKNIFGTCAGAILMSRICNDKKVNQLNIIDIESKRNSWGRQVDSFHDYIKLSFSDVDCSATFIRAPKIKILTNNVEVLADYKNEPVVARSDLHLVSTFHPEVDNDLTIHKYFLEMIDEKK